MEHYFILAVIGIALILFASEKFRPDVVGLLVMLTLILTGTVTIQEGFSGFSNPAVITVIAMFIISAGLVSTGVAEYIGLKMLKIAGSNPILLTLTVMLTVGCMSAFMNNIGATAILISAIFAISKKVHYPSSKLLIPLSFGSLLGGLTTLIGTPPNLLVSMALSDYGFKQFSMFDYFPTGILVMLAGALYMAFIGRHLLPNMTDNENYTSTYHLDEYVTEIMVTKNSSFIGKTIENSDIQKEYGLTVLSIKRVLNGAKIQIVASPESVILENDRLIVEGNIERLFGIKNSKDFNIHIEAKIDDEHLTGENIQMAELAIAPNSTLIGQSIQQADVRNRFGVLAIALRRRGGYIVKDYVKEPLDIGDVLLVQGKPETLSKLAANEHFLMTKVIEKEHQSYKKAPYAIAILILIVTLAATNTLHISAAGFIGVVLMILTGCVKVDTMYKAVEWRVIFLIACMMPLGIAMDSEHTGTAEWLADLLVSNAGDYGPLFLLASLYLLTVMLTEVMSNAAAAVLVAPIGISIAVGMNLQPYPFMMAIAIGASSTFITPIGHQANVLVYGIAGYKFTDFTKVGVWLNIIIFTVTMFSVPYFWDFLPLK